MELFVEFLGQQWMLVIALMMMVAMLMFHESQKSGQSVTPQELVVLMNKKQAVVVDLRDSNDFRAGAITDAINIPFAKLAASVGELENHNNVPIVLVCKLGQHTGAAGKILKANGFDDVYRLSGGMSEWGNSRFPTVKS